jgi:subtilase family serine protease
MQYWLVLLLISTLVVAQTLVERVGQTQHARHYHISIPTNPPSRSRQGTPQGPLSPSVVKSVYSFPTSLTAGSGQTVGIVDAFNNPNVEADLAVFNNQFGLPACTIANGCLTITNQTGGSTLPAADSGWAGEIALDVQWVHAIAPGAKILLVLAKSTSINDLMTAVRYASQHSSYVSMSFGAPEFSGQSTFDTYMSQAGVSFFAASGDTGAQSIYPSASVNAIGVGGTTINFSSGSFASESGWSASGGGCSKYISKPAVQNTGSINCAGKRGIPDVAAIGDPQSGVYVYNSYGCSSGCWYQVGGTSLATPVWAARSAVSGQQITLSTIYNGLAPLNFRDITAGTATDGTTSYSCVAGYDLVTGRGSWNGQGTSAPVPTTTTTAAPAQVTTTKAPTPAPTTTTTTAAPAPVTTTRAPTTKAPCFLIFCP